MKAKANSLLLFAFSQITGLVAIGYLVVELLNKCDLEGSAINDDTNIFMPNVALRYIAQGKKAALATVVSTWGSAPRGLGSQLAISSDGDFEGSVSGGCVEGAVIIEALEAIEDGKCRVLEYGVTIEDAFAVGLACGGEIKILVEPIDDNGGMPVQLAEDLSNAYAHRQSLCYQINLKDFTREIPNVASQQTGLSDGIFTMVVRPKLRLVIVGAVHITKFLADMAAHAEYDVFLIDPRESFASKERFPNQVFLDGWPDAALETFGIDDATAIVTLTHDPKIDTPALVSALKSNAFYIGALGSNRTHTKRVNELKELGFDDQLIGRIRAPVGLDIGSKSPAEIAISIMAEITRDLRKIKLVKS